MGNISGTNDQKKHLLTEHIFETFCDALRNPRFLDEPGSDNELRVLLDGVFHLLRFGHIHTISLDLSFSEGIRTNC